VIIMSGAAGGIDERGLGVLYARAEGDVRGWVRSGVEAPEAVIEDACQFAWCRLVHHRARVSPDGAVAWVVVTAVHEAVKLNRRACRELSLEALIEETGDLQLSRTAPSAHDALEPRLRLELIDSLPSRRGRLVWLQALGFTYPEIATRAGETVRSVERQLTHARAALDAAGGAAV
jgi:DNA-directed RNA polymerase specialized sigma24 family protein